MHPETLELTPCHFSQSLLDKWEKEVMESWDWSRQGWGMSKSREEKLGRKGRDDYRMRETGLFLNRSRASRGSPEFLCMNSIGPHCHLKIQPSFALASLSQLCSLWPIVLCDTTLGNVFIQKYASENSSPSLGHYSFLFHFRFRSSKFILVMLHWIYSIYSHLPFIL